MDLVISVASLVALGLFTFFTVRRSLLRLIIGPRRQQWTVYIQNPDHTWDLVIPATSFRAAHRFAQNQANRFHVAVKLTPVATELETSADQTAPE